MSVLPSDIVVYGATDMPEADGVTIGGAVAFSKRLAFTDIAPNGTLDAVSSSASDTATKLEMTVRDATGAIQTSAAVTLTSTTPVTAIGAVTAERLLAAVITGGSVAGLSNPGGTAAVGDVALYAHTPVISAHTAQAGSADHSGTTPALFKLQSGDGTAVVLGQIIRIKSGTGANQLRTIVAVTGYGSDVVAVNRDWATVPDATSTYDVYQGMLFEIAPNPVTAITRMFATAAADVPGGSARSYYEKGFVVNNNTATALTGAQIEIAGDSPSLPSGAALDIALTTSLGDSGTVANRQTAPSSGIGAFVTQPALIDVPGSGNLPPGAVPNSAGAQGVWFRLTLPAGTTAYKGSVQIQAQGATT